MTANKWSLPTILPEQKCVWESLRRKVEREKNLVLSRFVSIFLLLRKLIISYILIYSDKHIIGASWTCGRYSEKDQVVKWLILRLHRKSAVNRRGVKRIVGGEWCFWILYTCPLLLIYSSLIHVSSFISAYSSLSHLVSRGEKWAIVPIGQIILISITALP